MFAWAEDGIFPRAIAAVHPRFRTPHVAILASAGMATLGIIGSHVAGDFFLGVDILVTSMLVNFLLMAVSVLTLPAAQPRARARGHRAPVARGASAARRGRHRGAGRVSRRAHVEGRDRARCRVVFPLDAGVAAGDGRRARSSTVRETRKLRRQGVDLDGALRGASSRIGPMTLTVDRDRAGPRSLDLARAHRPLADRRHGARRPRARPRADGARRCAPYVDAGLHRRSTWPITTGRPRSWRAICATDAGGAQPVQLFTKWVPKPGPLTLGRRARGGRAIARSGCATEPDRPAAVPCVELCRSELDRRPAASADAQVRGTDRAHRPDERGRGAPEHGARQRHRGDLEPGLLLAARSARGRARCRPCASRAACSCSPTERSPAAGCRIDGSASRSPTGSAAAPGRR